MDFIKINTVKQITSDKRFLIYKTFDRCFTVTDTKNEIDISEIFETLKEAKKYILTNFY